jgi:hypothetical protein
MSCWLVVDCPQIAPISTNSERPDVATRVRTVEGRFRPAGTPPLQHEVALRPRFVARRGPACNAGA